METVTKVAIDGVTYETASFSPTIQQAVSIHATITAKLQEAQVQVITYQAALQTIGAQISEAIKQELATQTELGA